MNIKDIIRVLVVGSGTMGEGIAQNFAQAGLSVFLVDISEQALGRCRNQINANLALLQEFGLVSETQSHITDRIDFRPIRDLAGIGEYSEKVDFVVEAIPENLALKRELFFHLDPFRKDVVLCSNTSSLTMSEISEAMQTPDRVVGLHYFYPAHIIPLVEIHGGKHTSEETISIAKQLMLRVGKKPIVVRKEIPGLVVNRIQAAYNREVTALLNDGVATAEELDLASKAGFGFRLACLGPLEIHDLNGLDVVLKAGGKTRQSICNDREPSPLLVEKVKRSELGVKTGKGWHDYQGRTREEVLEHSNRKLLRQLLSFNTLEKNGSQP